MAQFNPKNLPGAVLGFALSAFLIAVGIAIAAYFLGTFDDTPRFVTSKSAGVGVALVLGGFVVALNSTARLFERDWGDVEVPSLAPDAYLEALTHAEPPAWTCTRCRVVQPGRGLGTCIYCDSGTAFYTVDSAEDLQMIIASIS